jgi:DNA-directed RNA polymerase specialized sigma24 family protein
MPSSNVRENKLEKGAEKLAELDERIKKAEAKKAFIESEIRKLKPHQRALIAAVDIQLRPIPAVAREMGVSEKAIRKARNRIIDKMFLQV